MLANVLTVALVAGSALAHGDHEGQMPIAGPHKALWYNTLPGDGGTQVCQWTRNLSCTNNARPIPSSLVSRPSGVCHTIHVWLQTM
jgi:hypothetical protein